MEAAKDREDGDRRWVLKNVGGETKKDEHK
jgi:hypothetical protein